jgi:hypothetical protein
MAAHLNLVLALLWLAGAVYVFWSDYVAGGPQWRIRGTNVSFGWLLLVMTAYNLVRWYFIRAARRARAAEEKALWLRRAPPRRRPDLPPDPNFQFTDEPPPPPGPITDRPPEGP